MWQAAQGTLTKKREALVKLELGGKQDKIPHAQEEVKDVSHLFNIEKRIRVVKHALAIRSNIVGQTLRFAC